MKKIILTGISLLLAAGSLQAQSEIDAYKYSKTDLNGTARFMGMGGAFGALGGDISTLANNPAGIAIYRTSEFATTLNLSNVSTKTEWNGTGVSNNKWKLAFNNATYVGTFKAKAEGFVNFNFGIGFNRLKEYSRNYTAGNKSMNLSLTDYIASKTNNYNSGNGISESSLLSSNAYSSVNSWISILGYDAALIDLQSGTNNYYNPMNLNTHPSADMKISERGYLDEYNISFGGNVYDVFYFGASVGITDLNYKLSAVYKESFGGSMGGFTLNNLLETRGSGVNLKAGVILKPTDFFRFGLAVHTPTFTKMTDYFDANIHNTYSDGTANHPTGSNAQVYVPENAFAEYMMQSPFKMQASAAFILGKKGILSMEYEFVDYSNMKMKDIDGYELDANNCIQEDFKAGHNLRFGGEFRVTPQISLRAGYATQPSPIKAHIINQDVEVEMYGSTLPHYTLDRGTTYYTAGLGYRFGSIYTDFALVSKRMKEDLYAFSPIRNGSAWDVPTKATLKTNTIQALFTFGVKF